MIGNGSEMRHKRTTVSRRQLSWRLVAAALAFVPLCAISAVLDDVTVSKQDQGALIEISFSCTVRYMTHFPQETGDELRVRVKPLRACAGDPFATLGRETMRPRNGDLAKLTEVTYEGDTAGGAYLTLYFSQPVEFSVRQGGDFRSITIEVKAEPEAK